MEQADPLDTQNFDPIFKQKSAQLINYFQNSQNTTLENGEYLKNMHTEQIENAEHRALSKITEDANIDEIKMSHFKQNYLAKAERLGGSGNEGLLEDLQQVKE